MKKIYFCCQKIFFIFCILFFSLQNISSTFAQTALPAFPGAVGYGSKTIGGRGGKIIFVTNTNDTGNGSFREALQTPGPRTILFRTGGVIFIKSNLTITEPYLTIAGQTAPGDGITIRGGKLKIQTHDVIVRGLRFRVGDDLGGISTTTRDGINISTSDLSTDKEVYNVIIDHCSVAWGIDENISTWGEKVHDITFSWNVSAQALYDSIHLDEGQPQETYDPHSMGFFIGDYSHNITVHHNLFAHNHSRPPAFFGNTTGQLVNNVIYNWGSGAWPVMITNFNNATLPSQIDVEHNYIKRGINTTTNDRVAILISSSLPANSKIFVNQNYFYSKDGQQIGVDVTSDGDTNKLLQKTTTRNFPQFSSYQTSQNAYTDVLLKAGAFPRDTVDTYVANSVKNGTGTIIDCVVTCDEPTDRQNPQNGFPAYNAGTPPIDTDADGIPDIWEKDNGLNPTDTLDSTLLHASGYTWLEMYINEFYSGIVPLPISPTPAGPKTIILEILHAYNQTASTTLDVFQDGKINNFDFTTEALKM